MSVTKSETRGPHAIEIDRVSYWYGDVEVLKNVGFVVAEGDYVGIIGPNGSGKTTLLKVILGLLTPQEGTVRVLGQDVKSLSVRTQIGYVPQRVSHRNYSFPATVEEVIGSIRGATDSAVEEALVMAELTDIRSQLVSMLSGGQRQRVFIARALASKPKILILDEPTVGVDVVAQDRFYAFIRKLNREHKLTILFVSHDVDVVAHQATTLLCLNRTVVCHGPPHKLVKEEYMHQLYGDDVRPMLHVHP